MIGDRWVVVRRRKGEPRISPLWPGWSAWCEHGGRGGIVTQIRSFPTHAEALAYADRRARTIEVTLPRDPDAREVARAGEWTSWKGDGWAITSNDPERAALNVLAYYYRKARA